MRQRDGFVRPTTALPRDTSNVVTKGMIRSLLPLKLKSFSSLFVLSTLTDRGRAMPVMGLLQLRRSCSFGAKGVDVVLRGCPLLEELSIKRLRGLHDPSATADVVAGAASLRSICLKDLYNGQCFAPLIAGSPNLKTLKLIQCSGDWDPLLEDMAARVPGVVEVHLERVQVSDGGLSALSACAELEFLRLVKTPECTDAGIAAVADGCPRLRKLHIDGWKADRISDEGLTVVARRCAGLQELVLVGVNATMQSLELIASNCGNLERLTLCSSDTFGDDEMACVASKCAAMKKLCIKGCPISNKGMEALAVGCPKLVKVKVKRCSEVTSECAEQLVASRQGRLEVNFEVDEGSIMEQQQQEEGGSVLEEFGTGNTGAGEQPLFSLLASKKCRWPAGLFAAATRNIVTSALLC